MRFRRIHSGLGASSTMGLLAMWMVLAAPMWGAEQATGGHNSLVTGTSNSSQQATAPAATHPTGIATPADSVKVRQLSSYSKLPLSFVPNRGQTDPQVRFTSQGRGYALFLTPDEAVLSLVKPERIDGHLLPGDRAKADAESSGVLRMKLAGAQASVNPTGAELLPGKTNYYFGNDPKKWLTNVPNYGRVNYADVYPGVDLVYYGSNQRQLEYDFVVKPGADPKSIRLSFDLSGMSDEAKKAALSIDANGDLLIQGAHGDLSFHKPIVYQLADTSAGQARHTLNGKYVLTGGNEVRFALGDYDKRFPLVIDPVLSYSTYLGGAGPDSGNGIAIDGNNNVDVTGSAVSLNFPRVRELPTVSKKGYVHPLTGIDLNPIVFVSQINAQGSLAFSTLIGGTGGDGAYALALDIFGSIYVTGTTHSDDFPILGSALQTGLQGPSDAFLVALSSTGSVGYSTYGGGAGNEDGLAIYIDSNNNIYVAGDTSTASGNLIGNNGPLGYQTTYGGGASDGFVAVLSTTSGISLTSLSYFGGAGTDVITAITADNNGDAYVAGRTSSSSFVTGNPATIISTYDSDGSFDAFAAEISTRFNSLTFFTYLGGAGDNEATGIALDPQYIAYVATSQDVVTGKQLVSKVPKQKVQPDVYTLGSGGSTLFSQANVYVTGSTTNPSGFFQNATVPPTTTEGPGGGKDAFVVKIAYPATQPVLGAGPSFGGSTPFAYANFFGGSGDDVANAILPDLSGNIYLAGTTNSANFPQNNAAPGACTGTCGTGANTDAFLARLDPEGVNLVYSSYLGGSGGDTGNAIAQDINAGTWLTGATASTDFPTLNPLQSSLGNSNGNTNAFVTGVAGVAAIRNLPGFNTTVFPANDDGSVDSLLGANFNNGNGINFFGTTYSDVWINNNGNLSFGNSYSTFTPSGLTESGVPPIIAPYWADVETSGNGSGLVTYGNDTVNGFNAFGVNYINVGYYDQLVDWLNSFQVILIDRQDVSPGDFDIEFNYGKLQWEAGEASGGADGQCIVNNVVLESCSPPHVGYSNGSGLPGTFYELPGSGVAGAFLDSNTSTGLIRGIQGSNGLGRVVFTVRSGAVQSADLGISMTPAPSPVALGSNLTYTITVTNNGPSDAESVAVNDTLPANSSYVSATPSQGTCGGTSAVSCSLGTITNGNSATITIVVTVNSGTSISNTATVSSPTFDTNSANNTAGPISTTVNGVPAPSIAKTFGAPSILPNGTTSLNFSVSNPSSTATLSSVGFTDAFPAGLSVASPSGLASTCGGTAGAAGGTVSLSGVTLASSASCTLSVNVTATTPAVLSNSVTVTSANNVTGNTSTASLAVAAAPTITNAFGAPTIAVSGSTTLTYQINNPNTTLTATGITFTDVLPAGIAVSTPNGLTGGCGGGTITASPGASSVSLAGASLAPSASCTFTVNVTGTSVTEGPVTNSVAATSGNSGTSNTSQASLTVVLAAGVLSPPVLAFGNEGLDIPTSSQTATLQNISSSTLSITGISVVGANSGEFSLGGNCGATLAAGNSCQISVTFNPTTAGAVSPSLQVVYSAPGSPQIISLTGTGVAPIDTFSVPSLSFQHNLNLTCPPKPVVIQNTGTVPMVINGIAVTGSFSQTNTCGATLAVGASCEVDVTFTAEAPVNTYNGTLTITDSAPSSPQVISLSGQVFPPCLLQTGSPSVSVLRSTPSTTFNISDSQPSCHTSTISLACTNNAPATCAFNPPTMQPGGSSVLTVQNLNAVPTDNFSFTATGTDTTNTGTVNLSLLLEDFNFTAYPATGTVSAGQTATFAMTLTPVNGLAGTIQLACQGAPTGSTCSVTPASVSVSQNFPVQVSVAVTTSGAAVATLPGSRPLQGPGASGRLWMELASLLVMLGLIGWMALGRGKRTLQPVMSFQRVRVSALVLAALALMLMAWAACGGGGAGNFNSSASTTPAGTYALTVTGTYASSTGQTTGLTHTQALTLKVQ